jgi:hypothetical protein
MQPNKNERDYEKEKINNKETPPSQKEKRNTDQIQK